VAEVRTLVRKGGTDLTSEGLERGRGDDGFG
jgi:hypothetical protein